MDRFIAENYANARAYELYLKSNMDRFIASAQVTALRILTIFKIQYG